VTVAAKSRVFKLYNSFSALAEFLHPHRRHNSDPKPSLMTWGHSFDGVMTPKRYQYAVDSIRSLCALKSTDGDITLQTHTDVPF